MESLYVVGAGGIGCAVGYALAAAGMRVTFVDADPEKFFRPPYVGHRGWLGVRLDVPTDWDEIQRIVHDAYRTIAPPKLAATIT